MKIKTAACLFFLNLASTLVESSRQVTLTCGADDGTTRGFPGAPGKRGAKGVQGVKGEQGMKGERGERDESRKAIETLQQRVAELEVQLARVENQTEQALKKQKDAALNNATNCDDVYNSGVRSDGAQTILVNGQRKQVYCQFQKAGYNWLIFQKRFSGELDYYLNFNSYVQSFGDVSEEFWLGLETLHQITNSRPHRLRVDLEDWEGNTAYAEYNSFSIGDSSTNYRLTLSGYSGNAGDSLSYHNNHAFSTHDRDDDGHSSNCALNNHGAWWYNGCHYSNLNGEYLRGGQVNVRGLTWYHWKNSYYSMKKTEMKVRHV